MMTLLSESALAQPLLAFVTAYYVIVVLWGEVRRRNPAIAFAVTKIPADNRRSIEVVRFYRLLTLAFTTIVLCFTLYPKIYSNFIPIRQMDIPIVNLVGIALLLGSFIHVFVVQLDFDNELQRHEMSGQPMRPKLLTIYSKKMVVGYLIMFCGITITLANVLSTSLFIIALISYLRKK